MRLLKRRSSIGPVRSDALTRLMRHMDRKGLLEGRTIDEIRTKSLVLMALRAETIAFRLRHIGYYPVRLGRVRVIWEKRS